MINLSKQKSRNNFLYIPLINEETNFVRLRKFCTLCAVSLKPVRLHILENKVEYSQNALQYVRDLENGF